MRSDGIRKIAGAIVVPRGSIGRPVSAELEQHANSAFDTNTSSYIVLTPRTRNTGANTLALYRRWINEGVQMIFSHLGSTFATVVSNKVFQFPHDKVVRVFSEEEVRQGSINATGKNQKGIPESLGDNRFFGGWAFMSFADVASDNSIAIYMKLVYEIEYMRDSPPTPNLPMTMLGAHFGG